MPVEEKKRADIEKEARRILDKFSHSLRAVGKTEEWNVERKENRRKEDEGKASNETFRKIMFENAPQHDDDFIKAEKKSW